jgi:hypothetical protein
LVEATGMTEASMTRSLPVPCTRNSLSRALIAYLEPEDVDEALQYAALLAEDETVESDRLDA